MKNYIHPGRTVPVTAPRTVVSGEGVLLGALFGVAAYGAASGDPVELSRSGVYALTKADGVALTQGQKAYWDNTNFVVTGVASGNTLIGAAVDAAAAGAAVVPVVLDGAAR